MNVSVEQTGPESDHVNTLLMSSSQNTRDHNYNKLLPAQRRRAGGSNKIKGTHFLGESFKLKTFHDLSSYLQE